MERDGVGIAEAYRAPEADDDVVDATGDAGAPFYVVSLPKLTILFVATLGIYGLYWFYQQWKALRRQRGLDVWPWARALLSVFYTHQLFRSIDLTARAAGFSPAWRASSCVCCASDCGQAWATWCSR